MSISNCCFLTCIQISQEAGQVVGYSYLFQNFPQFVVIHIAKGFGIVNKADIDVFLEPSCYLMIQQMLVIWSLFSLIFLKPTWSSRFTYWVQDPIPLFRKKSTSTLLTTPKPLTVWITANCGKFWKRWEFQTTWPASWEICMQVKKQQLELDMKQQTVSK